MTPLSDAFVAKLLYQTNYSNLIQINPDCVLLVGNKIICDPSVFSVDIHWPQWQLILKIASQHNQSGKCICGQALGNETELHHALLTKADLRGVKNKERIMHNSYNVLELHHACHEKITRGKSFTFLVNIYGEKVVKNWYDGVELKIKPRNLW